MLNGEQRKNHGNDNNKLFSLSNGKQRKKMIKSFPMLNGNQESIVLKWCLYPMLNEK